MNPLLLGLAKSLGLAGLMVGILFLLYRQLLAMKVFLKLSQLQSFALLTLVVILVFSATMIVIVRSENGTPGLSNLSLGAYKCSTPSRANFSCSLDRTEASGVALTFEGPNSSSGVMLDSFRGELEVAGDAYSVSMINAFNAEPSRPEKQQTKVSKLVLRSAGKDILRGTWDIDGQAVQPFRMEKAQ